jgi:L-amino acid N-acyltransferase YncA
MGIAVRPSPRGASVGCALMDQVAKHALGSGIRTWGLPVGRRNADTMDLVRTAGFPVRA